MDFERLAVRMTPRTERLPVGGASSNDHCGEKSPIDSPDVDHRDGARDVVGVTLAMSGDDRGVQLDRAGRCCQSKCFHVGQRDADGGADEAVWTHQLRVVVHVVVPLTGDVTAAVHQGNPLVQAHRLPDGSIHSSEAGRQAVFV